MRTSAGTLGFVGSSSKGSSGASARIVNKTALIPTRTGIEISVRRSRYLDMMLASRRGGARGREAPGPPPPALGRLCPQARTPHDGAHPPPAPLRPPPGSAGPPVGEQP